MSQISYSALLHDYYAATDRQTEMVAIEAIFAFTHTVSVEQHGASRSKCGDNVMLAMKSDESLRLNRTVVTAIKYKGEPILADNRNQSFSVSRNSKRVKTDFVDKRMLHMRTDAEKMAKAANEKRQNNRTPLDALKRIENKLAELVRKLEKAIRQNKDTTAIDALILRCNYYRHREIVRLAELQGKGDAKDIEATETAVKVTAKRVEFDGLILGERPVIPASIGRVYKQGRKVLKDRPSLHGATQGDDKRRGDQPDHSTGRVTGKPGKRRKPSHGKRGPGSY